ncbi:tRNA-binding protein [Oceanicaulis alexandrii]|uniref:tRNA-binding protein n=1 Tax=Oceanicaulis alexandrii TaxID=153233 RepID=UPI0035CEAA35
MSAGPAQPETAPEDFFRTDIRLGTIVRAEPFPEARKPAIKLWVDFGPEVGERKSSAQITDHYTPETLVGRRVLGVVNFPPRQIGPVRSEVLVLGVTDADGSILLLNADGDAPNGARVS